MEKSRKDRVTRRVRILLAFLGGAGAEVVVAAAAGAGALTPAASSSSDSSGAGAGAEAAVPAAAFLALRLLAHSAARASASERFAALVFLAAGEEAAAGRLEAAGAGGSDEAAAPPSPLPQRNQLVGAGAGAAAAAGGATSSAAAVLRDFFGDMLLPSALRVRFRPGEGEVVGTLAIVIYFVKKEKCEDDEEQTGLLSSSVGRVGRDTCSIFQVGFHFFHMLAFISAEPSRFFTFSQAARRISPLFYFTHPTRDCCQKYTCRA